MARCGLIETYHAGCLFLGVVKEVPSDASTTSPVSLSSVALVIGPRANNGGHGDE